MTMISPWWLGLTSDLVYEGGFNKTGRNDLDPEGDEVCGWCVRVWRARHRGVA